MCMRALVNMRATIKYKIESTTEAAVMSSNSQTVLLCRVSAKHVREFGQRSVLVQRYTRTSFPGSLSKPTSQTIVVDKIVEKIAREASVCNELYLW